MAPTTPHNKTLRVVCLILVLGINVASSGEYYGFLSKLYKKAAQENRPLILVLDNSSDGKAKGHKYAINDEYRVDNLPLINIDILDQFEKKLVSKPSKIKLYKDDLDDARPRPRYREKKSKLRFRDDRIEGRDRWEDDRQQNWDRQDDRREDWDRREDDRREDRERRERRLRSQDGYNHVLRSPILKNLLRISNSLRCEAKDKCQDSCSNKFNGKKLNECENKCDIKYECDESDKDPCDSGSSDCGSEEKQGSTKGVLIVSKKPGCKRC